MRSLAADGPSRSMWALAVVVLFLCAWGAWFCLAPVTVYEVSADARLEVDRAVHPVSPQVSGRVVATHLQLGAQVMLGEPLVELDAETEKRKLQQEKSRLAGLQPQVDALKREMVAQEQSQHDDRDATRSAVDGARARQSEAETAAKFADEEARRLTQLREKEGVSELELLRVRAEGAKKRSAADALRQDLRRLEGDQRTRDSQSRARMEQLRRDVALVEGQLATSTAAIQVLEEEVEKHTIRAPATGQLGEVSALQIGAVLHEGDRLGTVVPGGQLKVVAEFPPAASLGRIRPGQPARVRLEGFPWMQYGALGAKVSTVASEARASKVRVELEVLGADTSPIPLQHGLPGAVEVEVEKVSPATLVLRAAGQLLSRPAAPEPSAVPSPPVSQTVR
jgi:membrane fusion protein (multidrug efflux system)